MKIDIPESVLKDITKFAEISSVDKVILFGSRARGTNSQRSDIDLAVYGGNFDLFYWNIMDKVDASSNISGKLKLEIEKDGVVIYEKV